MKTLSKFFGAGLVAAVTLLLAACSSSAPPQVGGPVVAGMERGPERGGATRQSEAAPSRRNLAEPLHMRGADPVRVGLLLPFSSSNDAAAKVASSMFDAAQLAAFETGDERFLLIPKDTRGTAEGAAAAARSAISDGAEILLGPVFSEEVVAVAGVARASDIPVIAFSSDVKTGGDGVYLLSFPPEIEIARVTDYAVLKGMSRFGLIAPATDYGERVASSFAEEIYVRGGVLVHEERYVQEPEQMFAPVKRLAQYAADIVPVALRHGADTGSPRNPNAQDNVRGYQAVMMPEQGTLLRALAPLLPFYNVDITKVKLLGVSAWNNPRLAREPALRGGWFAAPDPNVTAAFEQRFAAAFGAGPPRLASLAYDATLLAARLGKEPEKRRRFDDAAITDQNGYSGADGLFRLKEDGSVERGLAILEIQPTGIRVVDPAPTSFGPGL